MKAKDGQIVQGFGRVAKGDGSSYRGVPGDSNFPEK